MQVAALLINLFNMLDHLNFKICPFQSLQVWNFDYIINEILFTEHSISLSSSWFIPQHGLVV